MKTNSILIDSKRRFNKFLLAHNLLNEPIQVKANPLTPREAIGIPERQDYPILIGRERMLEALYKNAKGHAFTDEPENFTGNLSDVMNLPLDSNRNRAILIAVMNAVLRHFDEVEGTVHCRDADPEECALEIAEHLLETFGRVKVGLIGLNPAIGEALVAAFGADRTAITDLNPDNIGKLKFGVLVLNGQTETDRLIEHSDVVLVTGTTLGNETIDSIMATIEKHKKSYLLYGVTCASVCKLMSLPRICPRGYNE